MASYPARNDSRIVLHLDYDCFYASVFEVEQPILKTLPLAVQQKQIVVTCNYEARRRGLHKLQLIRDAKRICPDVVIVLGEDLTKFRNASKELYLFVKDFVWGGRVEKLGFDELSLDVTEMIDYNVRGLNPHDLPASFFHLDRTDPTVGFAYDAAKFEGQTAPPSPGGLGSASSLDLSSLEVRLRVASHLAGYIRGQLEHEKGYTATGGISTSKLLAKLVGNLHKPNSQTTLVPPYAPTENDSQGNIIRFLDAHEIRKIPGIGSRLAQKLKDHVAGRDATTDDNVTVRDVRLFPGMGPASLERILGGPGAPKGIGMRMWNILHGVDSSEVLEARDLPTQISIEDSYGRLDSLDSVRRELAVLAKSLIRRMRTDLLDKTDPTTPQGRWLAHPRTLRLSTRPRLPPGSDTGRTYSANRISRSAPLPPFVFALDENIDALAERLVQEAVLPAFRKLHPDKAGWALSLMNIAVTNFVESAGDQKQSSGRDIGKMFRQQESRALPRSSTPPVLVDPAGNDILDAWDETDEPLPGRMCPRCEARIPDFAWQAHEIYHSTHSKAFEAIRHVAPIENPVIGTSSHNIDYSSDFDLTFDLHDGSQRIKLELQPNYEIIAEDAYVQYLNPDGSIDYGEPMHRHEFKVFLGRALEGSGKGGWKPVGWARITVRRDGPDPLFDGAFSVGHNKHHIELKSTYLQKKRPIDADIEDREGEYMVVFRDSDMIKATHQELKRSLAPSEESCRAHELDFNADLEKSIFSGGLDQAGNGRFGVTSLNSLFGLSKRQSDIGGVSGNTGNVNLKSSIGNTAGCPKTKKVALIGVATDCQFTQTFSGNTTATAKQAARDWIISTVNTASNVYEDSFNVSLALKNLTINSAICPATAAEATPWNMNCNSGNITWRLNEFSKWRSENPDGNAYWTLMTDCKTGDEVGVSWMGQLCNDQLVSSGGQSVSGANVVVKTAGSSWQIFAHETGHTFGAVHDCESSTCAAGYESKNECCPLSTTTCSASGQYIMNPAANPSVSAFSECTIGNVCSAIGTSSVKSSCLTNNRGIVTITGSVCGNGIVEAGEECDCGGDQNCGDDPCCDPTTCKFKDGAVCDDSNDSCCTSCQFTPANTVCRPSTGQCDIAEYCTGTTGACPNDAFEKDGTDCGSSGAGLQCASGQCTSRDYQCRSVLGSMLNSNDTWACDNTNVPSCQLVCGAPEIAAKYGYSTCMSLNQNYLDGTPCDSGGRCSNGQCQGSSALGWINEHKALVIGICAGVGGLIVLGILSCLISRCRTARARKNMRNRAPPPTGSYSPYGGRYPARPPRASDRPHRTDPPMSQWDSFPDAGYQNVPPPYPYMPRGPPPVHYS
ncbi:hypothetical protein N7474_006906 [Penicillium riverlandense]|uniref:uncharacterized protein n=1 Tax=Penicillium riverlandense TaxID=1903569 RepID=UPI002547E3D9|nr:uncharacterized protein N7474_006906 [Penicillium riverlandense]KAJ5815129.1 hypothetical protein N7474_006906 [Penicillium riverlandense]